MSVAAQPLSFDVSRAILRASEVDVPLFVKGTHPLAKGLQDGELPAEANLQVVEIHGKPHAFILRDLLLHDVAQGSTDDEPWVVTFCPICNAGALFSATIDEQTYHFTAGGIYNAMAILRDVETGSYWDLIQGVCLYGPSEGKRLMRLATLRHMQAKDALMAFPDIELAIIELTEDEKKEAEADDEWRRAARPEWSERMASTLVHRDERLPRLDMGLGIWTAATARYYPIITLNRLDNLTLDTLDGRGLVVYIDPESHIPDAFYTDATSAHWYSERLELDNGHYVQHGSVFDKSGNQIRVERPLQLFQRWYGFAALFHECEIFKVD